MDRLLREWLHNLSSLGDDAAMSALIWIALPDHAHDVLFPGITAHRVSIQAIRDLTTWLSGNGLTSPAELCVYLNLFRGDTFRPYHEPRSGEIMALINDSGVSRYPNKLLQFHVHISKTVDVSTQMSEHRCVNIDVLT